MRVGSVSTRQAPSGRFDGAIIVVGLAKIWHWAGCRRFDPHHDALLGAGAARGGLGLTGPRLPLGGRKQRRLLALLLLHANRVVERDQLMESAWQNAPPPSARESLDAYVYRLRQLLGHDRIARQDGGYVLRIGPGELDVDEFEQLVARAGEAIQAGEHRAATAALEQALGLCRGAAWPELDGDLSALGDAHRIDELRISATEAMLEARLALGIGWSLSQSSSSCTGTIRCASGRWQP